MILSTVPCRTRSWNKIKPIVHATAYDTLIISCKSKVGLSFTCPKNWRNRPKRLKILKTEHLPRLIYRSSYVNRIRNLKKFFKFIFHLVHNHIHYICFASNYKSIYIYIYIFFYVGFLARTFANHRTAREGEGHFFNSSLPLPPASQKLRH